jgi:hypothetical protein
MFLELLEPEDKGQNLEKNMQSASQGHLAAKLSEQS